MSQQIHEFDAVVVGSGTSAYYAAEGLKRGGKKIAIIDERPYGGTCALRGCQPKKYLVCSAEAVAMASKLAAVKFAVDAAIETHIAHGRHPERLADIIAGKGISTRFHAAGAP